MTAGKKYTFNLLLLLCGFLNLCWGQKQDNFWVLGDGVSIDFGYSTPLMASSSISIANGNMEGCAAMSDQNGNLLLYTDGESVWNSKHNLMNNGTGIGGDRGSSQSAVIVPKPGDASIYYIFTTDRAGGSNGLRYSEVDISANKGIGQVTSKGNLLIWAVSEKITATLHTNGYDYWVLTHEWYTNNFIAFKVTCQGVDLSPVISAAGSKHEPEFSIPFPLDNAAGYMKISPDGSSVALAVEGTGFVEVFDFDVATGIVNNPIKINGIFKAYGVEFSPDNSKLYVSERTSISDIYQFDLTAINVPASKQNVGQSYVPQQVAGALQLAPDGKIYFARHNLLPANFVNSKYLGGILQPNLLGSACGYNDRELYLGNRRSTVGLPNFASNYVEDRKPALRISHTTGNCKISLAGVSTITGNLQWNWEISHGNTTENFSGRTLEYEFESGTICNVTLNIRNSNCIIAEVLEEIEVTCESDAICFVEVPTAFNLSENNVTKLLRPVVGEQCELTDYHFKIFNRWGEILFETQTQDKGWNGFYNGLRVPVDVYPWYVYYANEDGVRNEKSGTTMVVR